MHRHRDQATSSSRTAASPSKHRRRNSSIKALPCKESRDLWAKMAEETQIIVLGDGKYVEERYNLPAASSAFNSSDGQGLPQGPPPTNSTNAPSPIKRIEYDIFLSVHLSRQGTTFYPHYCESLATWALAQPRTLPAAQSTTIDFFRCSTLTAARRLAQRSPANPPKVGVLSFASPKKPCGNFLHGSSEQEETIARLSSLIASLTSPAAEDFYKEHRKFLTEDGSGLHDHSMVYSPGVVVFRADSDDETAFPRTVHSSLPIGGSFIPPYKVDVVSSVPVNAAAVRSKHLITPSDQQFFEDGIRSAMKERMSRILRLFEEKGDQNLVLGAFGCSSSENKVEVVAGIWAELLVCGDTEGDDGNLLPARFKDVFENVVFAIPGRLFSAFKEAFELRVFEAQLVASFSSL